MDLRGLVLPLILCVGVACAAARAPVAPSPQGDTASDVVEGQLAPRLQTLGDHAHPITTDSPRAQLFFNQGLILSYGFNHKEARRSFQEAARLDPDAAMAWWGQALVLGPNINAPMDPANERIAWELVQQAVARKGGASDVERAYIDALAKRYSGDPNPDRAALDRAYAEAMAEVHRRFPDDLDAATLYAEALMDLSPWDYWSADGQPYPQTRVILGVLDEVLARDPSHPGANHFYIHAVEATRPALAEAAADRLVNRAPGAGHLQHMPAHIYVRVGRYGDASEANERAIAADEDYITQCRAQGIYPLAYYPHNIHFYWWSTSWEGRSVAAIAAAREVEQKSRPHLAELPAFAQIFMVSPLYALARFGRWDEILAEPRPPEDRPYWVGVWHYARGLALARKGRIAEAERELASLRELAGKPELAGRVVGGNDTVALLGVAEAVLAGELAAERGGFEEAIAALHRGVLLEERLAYIEPSDWYFPVRQALGAVLLRAGRAAEAEAVYWQDLRVNPDNGWSLFGLAQSLRAQGEYGQAAAIEKRFRLAWVRSDVMLPASRF